MIAEPDNWNYLFLPWFYLHSLWLSLYWNPHATLPILQEVNHLYFLLLHGMVDVSLYLLSEKTGLFVNHSLILIFGFLNWFPLYPFTLDLQSLQKFLLLSHMGQIIFYRANDPPPDPLIFPMLYLLKQTCLKAVLSDCLIVTVYDFRS